MMKVVYEGKLKNVKLTLAVGDLFQTATEAIVNSEQTDFILSGNPNTISGQIFRRYGDAIQDELYEKTKGLTFGAGTVLETSGGSDFKAIFHAGFHEPMDWPGFPGGSDDADYFEAIGVCISQILAASKAGGIKSVAFPLIGCGLFGLDEEMLVFQFLDALSRFDDGLGDEEPLNVWLVIQDKNRLEGVNSCLMDMLFHLLSQTVVIPIEKTGIPMLDRLSKGLLGRTNEEWAKWQLCHYTEIALKIMCFALCRAVGVRAYPESLFDEGIAATFGSTRCNAVKLAEKLSTREVDLKKWGTTFFSQLLTTDHCTKALLEINSERNNLAHGRKTRPLEEFHRLMTQSLQIDNWSKIEEEEGELCFSDWFPWVEYSEREEIGLFERWQSGSRRYVSPETGGVFSKSMGENQS